MTVLEAATCSGYPTSGTNVSATSTTGSIPTPGCASYLGGDVWFSFVVPSSGTVTVDLQSGGITNSGMAFYSSSDNTCSGTFTLIECDDDDSPNGLMSLITRTGLTPGATIFVRVWEFGNDVFGTFSVCTRTPPTCANPTSLTSGTITATSAILNWTENGAGTAWDIEIQTSPFTFTGTPTVTGVTKPYTYMGLTPSTQYQFRVRPSTPSCPSNWSTSSSTFTTLASPPVCASGTEIYCDVASTATFVAGTGAWDISACGFPTPGIEKVYRFTPTITGSHQLEITAASGGYIDYFFKAASNGCSSTGWTCIDDNNAIGIDPIGTLTAGVEYYILLDPESATTTPSHTFKIVCPVACANPTSLTSGTITTTSAILNWTENGAGTAWDIEIQPSPFTFTGVPTVTGVTKPYTYMGLAPSTQYQYRVRPSTPACPSNWSMSSATFTTQALPPTNDNCSDAVAFSTVPTDGSCITLSNQSTAGATQSQAACIGTANDDIWYSFVAAHTTIIVELTNVSGSTDRVHQIFSGTCGALTSIKCSDPETSTTTGLTIGSTYYIRVHDYFAGNTVFNICLKTPPPPPSCPGSLGAGTVNISSLPYDSGTGQTNCGNGNNITSSNATICGSSSYYGGEDKTYTFTPPVSGVHTILLTTAADDDAGITLYEGCPFLGTGGTCVAQAQALTGLTRTLTPTLTAGVTYYLVADNYPTPNCLASYRLQITPPCPTPTGVSSNSITSNSAIITWSCTGCTGSYVVEYGPPGFTPGTGAGAGVGGTVVTSTSTSRTLTGLNSGSVYNVYVRQNCGGIGYSNNSAVHIFNTLELPPSNDDCSGATTISNGSMISQTVTLATNDNTAPSCGGITLATQGVWFVYSVPTNYTGSITIAGCNSSYDMKVRVYEGSCGSFTCIVGDDNDDCSGPGSGLAETTTFNVDTQGAFHGGNSGSRAPKDYYVLITGAGGTLDFTVTANLVLPITISKISAHNMGKNNLITWTTSSEVNNDVQMVERSKDGISGWEIVGKVNGTNSRESVTYEVFDNTPFNTSFYRVHSVDFDGKEQFSKIVSVQREGRIGIITSIQPNPTANFIEIDLQPEFDGDIKYSILDATGKLLKTAVFSANQDASNTHTLDMADLQSGLYFVSIQGGGINQNAKIFKQ